jgi:GNAT superfamily N-acetyltransferase
MLNWSGMPRATDTDRSDDHARNTELLDAELPTPRYADTAYLQWLYDENPLGRAFLGNADEDGRRVAHYAVIPQLYENCGEQRRFVFSLHAVTRSGAQRKGYFSQLGEEIFEQARRWGALGVIGVSNENSTPPVVKRLDFRLLGPLPVKVVPAVGTRGDREFDSYVCDPTFVESERFAEIVEGLDRTSEPGWANVWSVDHLRWRLSAPNCGPYVLHVSDQLLAVSVADRALGRPVAVVLKLLRRRSGAPILAGSGAVSAACQYHRAHLAVYAGFNHRVRVRGVPPPRRLQPSPLNLIFRSLSADAPKETFRLRTFEFLDMDAY